MTHAGYLLTKSSFDIQCTRLARARKGKRLGANAVSEEARAYFPSPGRTETGSWDWALAGAARGAAGFGAGAAADSFLARAGIQPCSRAIEYSAIENNRPISRLERMSSRPSRSKPRRVRT